MKRILYFGDGRWATQGLQQLIEEGYHLIGVVLRRRPTDPELVVAAQDAGLSVYQPVKVNADDFVCTVADLKPDLNLSVSYDQILRAPILKTAPLGFVNFHAGKLPYYRGRNIINWAIINGETEIGLTAHFVDEGIDTGDIIVQHTVPVGWTDTYGDVLARVIDAFPNLISEAVRDVTLEQVDHKPQDNLIGTYFSSRRDGDEWLDWSDSSKNLHNKIRAITRPGPGARTVLDRHTVIIWRAFYDPSWPHYLATPGQVVGRQPNGVLVKTGDCCILIQESQVEDGEIRIPNWSIGTRLGINLLAYLHTLENELSALKQHLKTSLRNS